MFAASHPPQGYGQPSAKNHEYPYPIQKYLINLDK